ncbi:SURP and G-patch domain-containing protein 1-like isoform X3 [Homarus americanus]|uniref:SURP and G-patch domain-containing protein 1-like isoform X3 n=1 Tax=Homarus americanus TaxID=6706 RepID=UPI001C495DD3|nr:SURP and G-patch domain-containing protein 1-like isoform X3 [Homarus americanus]
MSRFSCCTFLSLLHSMSNKYPVQVRMREMSKQEEILLKRKREIERKMKEQQQADVKVKKASPPLPLKPAQSIPESSPSVAAVPQVPNKFSNDGSFFEQFKKLAEKQTDVKEEKYSSSEKFKSSRPVSTKLKAYNQIPPPKYMYPGHSVSQGQDSTFSTSPDHENVKIELNIHDEEDSLSNQTIKDVDQPDWFKDALKRAQAKAKQLSAVAPPVSLSAGSSDDEDSIKSQDSLEHQAKKRKSRWGSSPTPEAIPVVPPAPAPVTPTSPLCLNVPDNLMGMVGEGEHIAAIHGVMVTRLTRNNAAIIAYAKKVFDTTDLSEAQWKQCEDQMKMNVVFQLLQAKKMEAERLEQQGKVKYEYDSDEDVDGGTWEHKRRAKEMQETHAKATELTNMAEGKHHIGDFLPPDELARFMEKYRAIKEGRDPDLSDYQQHKLTEDNVGYRMLKSMGWTEGMGLGAEGKGITTPVNQNGRSESQGLGVERPETLQEEDDEYDAYRKRMMLAYRFRPNPLNNPRRAYY